MPAPPDPGEPRGADSIHWYAPANRTEANAKKPERRLPRLQFSRVLPEILPEIMTALVFAVLCFGAGVGIKSHDIALIVWMAVAFGCLFAAYLIRLFGRQ